MSVKLSLKGDKRIIETDSSGGWLHHRDTYNDVFCEMKTHGINEVEVSGNDAVYENVWYAFDNKLYDKKGKRSFSLR